MESMDFIIFTGKIKKLEIYCLINSFIFGWKKSKEEEIEESGEKIRNLNDLWENEKVQLIMMWKFYINRIDK